MEAKIAHLQMIQAVITRLSQNSFMIKGWAVTLVAALFALGATDTNELFIYLAYFPSFMFWSLDAYHLRQERLYRKLYDDVQVIPGAEIDFSMSTRRFEEKVDSAWRVGWSPTIRLFYGTITATIVAVMLVTIVN